jgi:hypothetical protein
MSHGKILLPRFPASKESGEQGRTDYTIGNAVVFGGSRGTDGRITINN